MKKLVIFDLDGTLLNTISDLAQAANYALKSLSFPEHQEEKYYQFVGNGVNKLLERALPEKERNAANIQKMRSFFIPYYDQHNTLFSRPYDGIMQVLVQLQKQGVLLAIASNKYQKATEKLVRHYFPQITFAVIVGQRDGIAVKPDPFCIREILEITHTDPQEVLYVGDSDVDVQTARRAQVCMCAVTWGFRSREELIACNPTYIADRAEEILDYV